MSARTKLVVGLGNPGRDYEGTRHNIGFEVADVVRVRLGCSSRKRGKYLERLSDVEIWTRPVSQDVWLAKPLTFMNRSGFAVNALVKSLEIAPTELLVVVDDADLPLGQLRLRSSGGSGGHNGLRSIIDALGSEEFPRLRVGIGRTRPVGDDITDHVLGKFAPSERDAAQQAIEQAAEAVECCVKEGLTTAMNRFNRRKGDTD